MNKKGMVLIFAIFVVLIMTGCASAPMNVLTPPADYATSCKELGEGEGTGSGFLFLHLIPIGINGRLVEAYQQAINSKGGTHLVNPSVKDYWYWVYIGQINTTKVKGKVINCQTAFAPSPITSSREGAPLGGPFLGPKLKDYYSILWPMIKEKWQFSKNPPREMVGIEATIVIVIGREGRVQKAWFEKKSGNDLFDDEAMRAIKSAEPFPPLPQELVNDTLKVGIRFYAE
jgi:TonB family protein